MTHTYTIILIPGEPDEGGYWVKIPTLPGCVTEGDTLEEALCNAKEAVEGYLLSLADRGIPIPDEGDRTKHFITAVTVEV